MSRSSMLYALAGSAIVGGVALFVGSSRLNSLFQSQPKGSRVSRHVKVKSLIVEPTARNEEPVPAVPTALDSTENAAATLNTDVTAPATHVEMVVAPKKPGTRQGAHKKDEAKSKKTGKSNMKASRKNSDPEAQERKRKASAAPEGQPSDPKHHHGTPPPKGATAASATHDVAPATHEVVPAARTRARSIAMSCGDEAEKLAQEVVAGIAFESNPLAVAGTAAVTAAATAPKVSGREAAETRPARTRARSIAMSCGDEAEKLAQEVIAGIAFESNPLAAATTAAATTAATTAPKAAEKRPARTRARSIAMSCDDEAEKLAQEVVAGIAYESNPLAAAATAASTAAATAPKAQRKKKAEKKAGGKNKVEAQTKADTTAEVARPARTRARSIAMSCGEEAEKLAQEVVAGIAFESNPLAAMATAAATAPKAQSNKKNESKKKSDDKKKSARKKKADTTTAAVPAGRTRARSIAMSSGEEAEKLAQEVVAGIAYESNPLVAAVTALPEASVPTANDSPPVTGRARGKSLLMSLEPSGAPPITVWKEGPAKNAGTASSPSTTSVENPLLQVKSTLKLVLFCKRSANSL
ncbi:hypothetical protein CYMTET_45298 [Cymbomonas tetramitiformis]|uniref:Uncharacterized protein n=1 Tax=Cymbomonas tetramitiformis TaxID=36881 RepID=A0AAE0BYH3_9CHLO|nr:hypothetical protein CYMTET_45298 [Cymbomonas tetramitiformis]|eukprot:gene8928-10580_t